jgi:CheY-like chemotaxis protein
MLLDLQLQDGTGVEVCRAVRSVRPSVTGLLLTASGDDEAWPTRNGLREPDVVTLVARMTQTLLGRGAPSAGPGTGRHRREPSG